jgi:hypothetical protein
MATLDAETVGAWLSRWWVESLFALVAAGGLLTAVSAGDRVQLLVAAALALALTDRVRLRMDNRSLAAAAEEVRHSHVSAVRRVSENDADRDTDTGSEVATVEEV